MPRKIIIQKRAFVRGKAVCGCCEQKFKYLLPVELLPFWDSLCSTCSLAVAEAAEPKGGIYIEEMPYNL